jgi:hypothetical protein
MRVCHKILGIYLSSRNLGHLKNTSYPHEHRNCTPNSKLSFCNVNWVWENLENLSHIVTAQVSSNTSSGKINTKLYCIQSGKQGPEASLQCWYIDYKFYMLNNKSGQDSKQTERGRASILF